MTRAHEDGEVFDGIIIDCTDVEIDNAVAASLFTDEFYQNIYKCLKKVFHFLTLGMRFLPISY